MPDMTAKIIDGARRCFFQHGFTRSTMSMIAEYSGCSRVTLYKYYKTKEDLFRELCLGFIRERVAESETLLTKEMTIWQKLESILASYIVSPFEEIGSDIISSDLVSATRTLVPEVRDERDHQLSLLLNRLIDDACQKNEISIEDTGIEPAELAEMIKLVMAGMAELRVNDLRGQAQRVVSVLNRALKPKQQADKDSDV